MQRVILKVLTGTLKGREFVLEAPGGLLGRDPACAVYLPEKGVSGHHARFASDDGYRWTLQDMRSTNGTSLNRINIRGETVVLPATGHVRVADVDIELRLDPFSPADILNQVPEISESRTVSPPTLVAAAIVPPSPPRNLAGDLRPAAEQTPPATMMPPRAPDQRAAEARPGEARPVVMRPPSPLPPMEIELNLEFGPQGGLDGGNPASRRPASVLPNGQPSAAAEATAVRRLTEENLGLRGELDSLRQKERGLTNSVESLSRENEGLKQERLQLQRSLAAAEIRIKEAASAVAGQNPTAASGVNPAQASLRPIFEQCIQFSTEFGMSLNTLADAVPRTDATEGIRRILLGASLKLADLRSLLEAGKHQS